MWTITSRSDLDVFMDQRALVSLLVDHAYVRKNIELFFEMREGFDALATALGQGGGRFHL